MGKPNIYQLIKKPSAKLIDMLVTDVREKNIMSLWANKERLSMSKWSTR
jgi:hypothetical protein